MNNAEKQKAYYDRVRPIIGNIFVDQGFLAYGIEAFPHTIEALIRTGVKRVFLENSFPITDGLLTRTLGIRYLSKLPAESFEEFSRKHNRFETDYEIQAAPSLEEEIETICQQISGKVSLILAYAPECTQKITKISQTLQIPAIFVSVLEESRASQAIFVFDPTKEGFEKSEAEALAKILEEHPAASPKDNSRREDFLEAGDLTLSFAKAILLQNTSKEREDLEKLWSEGRVFTVRGSPSWPWETRYLPVANAIDALAKLSKDVTPRVRIPEKLFLRHRVLVIGCGTASLFVNEIAHDVSALLLLDSKPFSIYNPIRQLCSTDDVEGEEKPFALQNILIQKLAPDETWTEETEGPIFWKHGKKLSIAAASLHLSEMDPESVTKFEEIVRVFKPTLAIVGMGRSRDDNFTACEVLRQKNVPHIVPTAFPGVTHFKHIIVEEGGPCYECLQNHLPIDGGAGPSLPEEARSVYYGGTQPATLAETYPSAHSLYRIARALALPLVARPLWWKPLKEEERVCLVGANQVEHVKSGWLYGCSLPGQMVAYGSKDIIHSRPGSRCICGRYF